MAASDALDKQNDELRHILECPVCMATCCTPPIFMCASGHHVCARCQPSLAQCPTCRAPGQPTLRCITLEKMAARVTSRCLSWRDDCKAVLNAEDMARHWVGCESRYQVCPCWVCWGLGLGTPLFHRLNLADHVQKEHPGCFSEEECTQIKVAVTADGSINYRRLVSAHGDLFWVRVHSDPTDKKLYRLYTSCIAGDEYTANYKYECEFKYCTADSKTKLSATICVETVYNNHNSSLPIIHKEMLDKCTTDGHFSFTSRIIRNK